VLKPEAGIFRLLFLRIEKPRGIFKLAMFGKLTKHFIFFSLAIHINMMAVISFCHRAEKTCSFCGASGAIPLLVPWNPQWLQFK
jgi:hypothetical protein